MVLVGAPVVALVRSLVALVSVKLSGAKPSFSLPPKFSTIAIHFTLNFAKRPPFRKRGNRPIVRPLWHRVYAHRESQVKEKEIFTNALMLGKHCLHLALPRLMLTFGL